MGSLGLQMGNAPALLPSDTSTNVEDARQFTFNTGLDVPLKLIMSTDGPVLQNTLNAIEKFRNQYPDLFNHLSSLGDYTDNSAFAATNGSNLLLNTAYFGNTEGLAALYQGTVDKGVHPAGTTWRDIVVHELGHVATRALIDKKYSTDADRIKDWSNGTTARLIVQNAVKSIQANYTNYGFTKKPTSAQLRADISKYASSNVNETIAEAWADHNANGSNAKPLSRVIWAAMQNM